MKHKLLATAKTNSEKAVKCLYKEASGAGTKMNVSTSGTEQAIWIGIHTARPT
jgi:hypothetical protein